MLAKLEFNLPEEQEEYDCFLQASKMQRALCELAELFRKERKYDGPPVTEDVFWDTLKDYDVRLE